MLNEGTVTILIIVIFVLALVIQLMLLNKVAKQKYHIEEQKPQQEGPNFHKPGPEVENPN